MTMKMMKLMEEKREIMEENDEEEKTKALFEGFPEPTKLVVGYALTSKKTKSFLQPKFQGLARYSIIYILFSIIKSYEQRNLNHTIDIFFNLRISSFFSL